MENRSRTTRHTMLKPSIDKCSLGSRPNNVEELKKLNETRGTVPFLRACGCAHRFSPSSQKGKSSNGFKKRSRSCTAVRTHFSIESDGNVIKLPKSNRDSLSRHVSEDDLHFNRIFEITEKLEFIPITDENLRCTQEDKMKPCRYKTTLCVNLDSSERKYKEEISFEVLPTRIQSEPLFTLTYRNTTEATIEHILSTNLIQ